jgi:hypothetical protein
LPRHSPAELAQLREWIARYGVLSAVVKTPSGTTIQGRAVETVAKELRIPSDKIPAIVAAVPDDEVDLLRVRLELGGRDRSALRAILHRVLISQPRLTSREIAQRFPELGDRCTIDRARHRLLAGGAIAPLPSDGPSRSCPPAPRRPHHGPIGRGDRAEAGGGKGPRPRRDDDPPHSEYASSAESVGAFWLGEVTEVV